MPDTSDSGPSSTGAELTAPASFETWLTLEIVEEAPGWLKLEGAEALAHAAGAALARHPRFASHVPAEACIALSSDAAVQDLNHRYRAKAKPTNVLSFPALPAPSGAGEEVRALGDIVLALETVLAEAAEQGIECRDHFQHLVIHGLLHLLGFDHENEEDAIEMEGLEVEILADLGIANPYSQEVDLRAS